MVWVCMNKKGFFTMLITVIVLLVVGFFWFVGERGEEDGNVEVNETEIVCVAASCCHASECVLESEAPDCSGIACTMSCEPDTMDCGAGSCGVVDGECGVIWDE